jgi:hypothetical protein
MASRTASNTFWGSITTLVDGGLLTAQTLYVEAIHRLQDNAYYVLGKVSDHIADLALQDAGGHAFTVGNVDITAFDFNSGIALNGLTIIVDEDTVAAQTCTFPNTITTPALLLAALNSQAGTNITWSLTDAGYLYAESNTIGAGSPTGTAVTALFGSASTTSPGSSSVNDGTTRIGFAGYLSGSTNIAAGTLRNALEEIITILNSTLTDLAKQTVSDGTTLVGFSGYTSGTYVVAATTLRNVLESLIERVDSGSRSPVFAALTNTTSAVDLSLQRVWTIPVFAGASVRYTLPVVTGTTPITGDRLRIVSRALNDTVDGVFIESEGFGDIFKFTEGDKYGYVDVQFESTADGGSGAWVVAGWTVDNNAYALIDPYP